MSAMHPLWTRMEENRRRVEAMPKWKIGERFPVKRGQMTKQNQENLALRKVVEDYFVIHTNALPVLEDTKDSYRAWLDLLTQAIIDRKNEELDPRISANAEKAQLLDLLFARGWVVLEEFIDDESEPRYTVLSQWQDKWKYATPGEYFVSPIEAVRAAKNKNS